MAKDPYREIARMVLEPWLVETTLARLDRKLSPAEQRIIVKTTRTPHRAAIACLAMSSFEIENGASSGPRLVTLFVAISFPPQENVTRRHLNHSASLFKGGAISYCST